LLKPRALRPGDRIAIVSPASPFAREEFDRGVEELAKLGFEPVWEESVFAREGYVAGSADARASAFVSAWEDPSIAALIAARGGYGSVQLLPFLDAVRMRRTPKAFIGYSDTTALLTWLTVGCGIVGFHGPMLEGRVARGEEGFDRSSFLSTLTEPRPAGELAPDGLTTLARGEATGPLLGGTLTQLVASLGTPYAFLPAEGYVLLIEDVNERPYRVDRMLTQLRLAGVVGRARAIVFGEMKACDEPAGGLRVRDTVQQVLAGFPGPILFGFPVGHTTGPCWTLPLGVDVRVIASENPRVVVEEAAVA
jgi:muramoyltetrapeptide carboxypeptidase